MIWQKLGQREVRGENYYNNPVPRLLKEDWKVKIKDIYIGSRSEINETFNLDNLRLFSKV